MTARRSLRRILRRALLRSPPDALRPEGGRDTEVVLRPMGVPEAVYAARDRIAAAYLQPGWHGIEIGAGARPQRLPEGVRCTYVDVRDRAQLRVLFGVDVAYEVHPPEAVPARFPEGADFLIAHNVLEHAHDPIGTLIGWNAWLRDGGIGLLSLPDKAHCPPDAGRLSPDAFHLLCDHLFERGPDAFESRDHIPGFLAGWEPHIHPGKTRAMYARHALDETQRSGHDLHWHALDRAACDAILGAASALGPRPIDVLEVCSPDEGAVRTLGEVVYAYRVLGLGPDGKRPPPTSMEACVAQELEAALGVLRHAVRRLEAGRW